MSRPLASVHRPAGRTDPLSPSRDERHRVKASLRTFLHPQLGCCDLFLLPASCLALGIFSLLLLFFLFNTLVVGHLACPKKYVIAYHGPYLQHLGRGAAPREGSVDRRERLQAERRVCSGGMCRRGWCVGMVCAGGCRRGRVQDVEARRRRSGCHQGAIATGGWEGDRAGGRCDR